MEISLMKQCDVLVEAYNKLCRFVKSELKSQKARRQAFALDPKKIEELRASRPTYKTLVTFFE